MKKAEIGMRMIIGMKTKNQVQPDGNSSFSFSSFLTSSLPSFLFFGGCVQRPDVGSQLRDQGLNLDHSGENV